MDTEKLMGRHIAYWTRLLERRVAVAFGPVADPAGGWGAGITEAESEQAARDLHIDDPAVATGLCTFEVYPMPGAIVRGLRGGERRPREYFHLESTITGKKE
jgi:uncharacterized protein YciI